MTLKLHLHPLSSYCHKVLIALYENDTPFTPRLVDLSDPALRAAFLAISPQGKMPVLENAATGEHLTESSIVIDYLDQYFPGPSRLIPADRDAARACRAADRFYDLYLHDPMQRIVGDRLRPETARDPHGVREARKKLTAAYDWIEQDMAGRTWALGEDFSMADCAAAPALFYADLIEPVGEGRPNVAAYLERLIRRPAYARALNEARPFFKFFPFYGPRIERV